MQLLWQQLTEYMKLGFSPIPLKGKLPLVKWRDYEYNAKDFVKPRVNVGLRAGLLPSGNYLWFIDLDSKDLLGPFFEANPLLIHTPLVSTGRGFHLYLTWKEPVKTRVFNKMEIRGEGAYVVAPPSIHASGKPYCFITPLRMPPSYNPRWLIVEPFGMKGDSRTSSTKIVLDSPDVLALGDWGGIPPGVRQGQRHNTLVYYLGAMFNAHFTEEEALSKALAWNTKNHLPLSKEEVMAAVHSCWEKWDLFKA